MYVLGACVLCYKIAGSITHVLMTQGTGIRFHYNRFAQYVTLADYTHILDTTCTCTQCGDPRTTYNVML